jgi:hypothetical protein
VIAGSRLVAVRVLRAKPCDVRQQLAEALNNTLRPRRQSA